MASGTITNAVVNQGRIENSGKIEQVDVNFARGELYNLTGGKIGTASVQNGGQLFQKNGTIDTVHVRDGGWLGLGLDLTGRNIGTIHYYSGGSIGIMSPLEDGMLEWATNNLIDIIVGGVVQKVPIKTVVDGLDVAIELPSLLPSISIEEFIVHGTLRGHPDFHNHNNVGGFDLHSLDNDLDLFSLPVGQLKFGDEGTGMLHLTGFIDEPVTPMGAMGIQAMNASLTPNVSFYSGFNIKSIDLTNGSVIVDLSGLGYEEQLLASLFENQVIDLNVLFGAKMVSGVEALDYLAIALGNDQWVSVVNNGILTDGWELRSATPEPATLAIIGLGLAGLGLARRRRR